MTSSAIVDVSPVDTSGVVLQDNVIKGLYSNQRDDLKRNVVRANQAWDQAGNSVRSCAATLHEIKENTPKGNWIALLDSGNLHFSKSIAMDLVKAHQWLCVSNVPDRFLANISARTLGKISDIKDPATKQKVTEKIVETDGIGFSEKDLKKFTAVGKARSKSAGKAAKKGLKEGATVEEAIEHYTKIVDQMADTIRLRDMRIIVIQKSSAKKTGEIAQLKEKIKELQEGPDASAAS